MRTLPGLSRIALSPWSYEACDPAMIADLDLRATALDVTVSTIKRHDSAWMARARGQSLYVASFIGATLPDAIGGALDEYEAHERDRYTADELVVIYNQSEGI
jgi:hypothetical protein